MKPISRRKFSELMAFSALAGCAAPRPKNSEPVDWQLYSPDRYGAPSDAIIPWRLVAMSDLIASGVLSAPSEAVLASAQFRKKSVTLSLAVSKIFKGETSRQSLEIEYWPGQPHQPTPVNVIAARDSTSDIFLALSDEDDGTIGPYHFSPSVDPALQPASIALNKALAEEVARQETLAARTAQFLIDHVPPNDGYVAALIEQLMVERTAYDASQELLSLGLAHAAALVHQMDDRRPLAIDHISAPAPAGSFESVIHYGPETVVDLVSVALQQATGDYLGATANGGSERARRRVVDAWRVWLGRSLRLPAI
ncbi:MAG: hypothetical protein ACREEE_05180, partial [Dongiaceae bacterium]